MDEISGGEKQRVILARALAQQPSLLLLDEPTLHLDIGGKVELLRRLRQLAEENRYTVMVVTHELDLAAEFSDQVVLLHKGKCLRVGTPAEVYQRELLEQVFEAPLEVEIGPDGRPRVLLREAQIDSRFVLSAAVARMLTAELPQAASRAKSARAVNNHRRLRAREDGEKPSPPRDCKAKKFRREPLIRLRIASWIRGRSGKAAP